MKNTNTDYQPFVPFKVSHDTWYRLGILSDREIVAQYCRLADIDSIEAIPADAALSVSMTGDVVLR